jgi:hypothetical protein
MANRVVALAVLLAPALAAAEPLDGEVHATGGYELASGSHMMTSVFRANALLGGHSSRGAVRPSIAVGATFDTGWLYTDAMQPAGNWKSVGSWKGVGPELQGGVVVSGLRVYGSFAFVDTFRQQMPSSWGERAAIGLNYSYAEAEWAQETDGRYGKDSTDVARPLVFLLPEQFEAVYEHDDVGGRVGFAVSWGL